MYYSKIPILGEDYTVTGTPLEYVTQLIQIFELYDNPSAANVLVSGF